MISVLSRTSVRTFVVSKRLEIPKKAGESTPKKATKASKIKIEGLTGLEPKSKSILETKSVPGAIPTSTSKSIDESKLVSGSKSASGSKSVSGSKFKCPQCNFLADEKGQIKAHLKTVHKALPFMCSLCQKEFTNFTTLKGHVKTDHPGSTVPKEPYLIVLPDTLKQYYSQESAKVDEATKTPNLPDLTQEKIVKSKEVESKDGLDKKAVTESKKLKGSKGKKSSKVEEPMVKLEVSKERLKDSFEKMNSEEKVTLKINDSVINKNNQITGDSSKISPSRTSSIIQKHDISKSPEKVKDTKAKDLSADVKKSDIKIETLANESPEKATKEAHKKSEKSEESTHSENVKKSIEKPVLKSENISDKHHEKSEIKQAALTNDTKEKPKISKESTIKSSSKNENFAANAKESSEKSELKLDTKDNNSKEKAQKESTKKENSANETISKSVDSESMKSEKRVKVNENVVESVPIEERSGFIKNMHDQKKEPESEKGTLLGNLISKFFKWK